MTFENFHRIPVDPEVVAKLKQDFLQEYKSHGALYDPRDVALIESDDCEGWWVRRFAVVQQVDHKRTRPEDIVQHAFAEMKRVYQWRLKNRVVDIYEAGPQGGLREEFFTTGEIHSWLPDVEGRLIIASRLLANSTSLYDEAFMAPLLWLMEAVDREAAKRQTMIIFLSDMRSAGLKNFSVHQPFLMNEAVNSIAIGHLAGAVIVGMPFILKPLWKIVVAFLSGETVRNLTYADTKDVVHIMGSVDRVPGYLAPNTKEDSEKFWRVRPEGVRPMDEIAQAQGTYEANKKGILDYIELKRKVLEKLDTSKVIKPLGGSTQDYLDHFLN